MSVESVISNLGSSFVPLLEKLTGSRDIVHRGARIYHKSSEIEYTYQISIGPSHSRINNIVKTLKGYLSKPVEFNDVIEISGVGLPHNEDLKKLGIIQVKGKTATIDFSRIFNEIKSELVTLFIRKRFPEILKQKIVDPHLVKTSKYNGKDSVETNLEVALDYADLWHNSFDQFTIREIEFHFGLIVNLETVVEVIPKSFRSRFTDAAKEAQRGNTNALQFLKIASEKFMSFQSEKRIQQMLATISVQPEPTFKVVYVNPIMQSCEIAGVGYPINLPGSMKITIEARVEREEIALHGILRIDLNKFSNILKDIISEIEKETKILSF